MQSGSKQSRKMDAVEQGGQGSNRTKNRQSTRRERRSTKADDVKRNNAAKTHVKSLLRKQTEKGCGFEGPAENRSP